MEFVHKAEKTLEEPFAALPPLPKETRKGLAGIWPWLALIAGVLQLFGAWALYNWARTADRWIDVTNNWLVAAGATKVESRLSVWVWIAVIVLLIDAVILLLAFPKLQKRQKDGWDLLFLGALINLVYGVVSLFIDGRGGFGSLIFTLIASAIGFYLLYQVREFYGGKALRAGVSAERRDEKK